MTKKNKNLAKVYHYDLYGKRESKYHFLKQNTAISIDWKELDVRPPEYFFVPKDWELLNKYEKGFKIIELFKVYGPGVETGYDAAFVSFTKRKLVLFLQGISMKDEFIFHSLAIKNKKSYKIKDKLLNENITNFHILTYEYKVFDERFVLYAEKSLRRANYRVFRNFLFKENYSITLMRTFVDTREFRSVFVSKYVIDKNLFGFQTYSFPLYLYPDKENDGMFADDSLTEKGRKPNLNMEIVNRIAEKIGLKFVAEKPSSQSSPPDLGGVSEGRGGQNAYSARQQTKEFKQHIHNLPHLKTFRKQLRKNLTPAEAILWNMLKNKQLKGRKFRRQHSVGNYILDFYCPAEKLAVELDGEVHNQITQADYDYERDLFLRMFGIKVLRFENKEVFENPEGVLAAIEREFGWWKTTPSANADTPPYEGGEEDSHMQVSSVESVGVVNKEERMSMAREPEGSVYKIANADVFAPIDILDYIYAVLHSPTYREKYKEFLKIDFPRVPYPKDKETFWQLVKLGGELRQIHLLESPKVNQFITSYPVDGNNKITTKIGKKDFEITDKENQTGRIWINDKQYFDNVPVVAWEFYIGGYQLAQKWLKDRRGRILTFDDILHYQKIIVALYETDRIMKEIDKIEIE